MDQKEGHLTDVATHMDFEDGDVDDDDGNGADPIINDNDKHRVVASYSHVHVCDDTASLHTLLKINKPTNK